MDSDEFLYYLALNEIHPSGPEADNINLARIAYMLSSGKTSFKDFVLGEKKRMTVEDMIAALRGV